MKKLYIPIFMVFGLLFVGCKQDIFQKAEQNSTDFTKLVRIADLVHLYELDSDKPFANSLYIEATVNGIDGGSLHIQDNSDFALRVFVNNLVDFKVGDLVRVIVGGKKISEENSHFVFRNPGKVEAIGNGFGSVAPATLAELAADISKFTSKVANVSELSFAEKQQREGVTAYLVEQDVAPDLSFWVNIPDALEYDMPMSVSSVRGFVVYENGNIYINARTLDDIHEFYVEPTMMEKLLNNSTLVHSVVHSTEEEIAPGVKMSEMAYMNNALVGDDSRVTAITTPLLVSCTVFEIDLNNPKVKMETGNPGYITTPYTAVQTLAVMAGHKNTAYAGTNWRVLAAVTGDNFVTTSNPSTWNPRGPIVKNGEIIKSGFQTPNDHFFGILKNREGVVIGTSVYFEQVKGNIEQAVGGYAYLREGQSVAGNDIREPRPAIGYTTNNKVFLFAGNGRDLNVSAGFSPKEVAAFLKALGCEGALGGAGGGSTVGVLEDSNGNYNIFSRTHASNPNHNPSLPSSWMIVTERE